MSFLAMHFKLGKTVGLKARMKVDYEDSDA